MLTRRETRARRLLTPALAKMFLRWSCTVCGLIEDVTLDAALERRLDKAFDLLARDRGFRAAGHSIDIEGQCVDCRNGLTPG